MRTIILLLTSPLWAQDLPVEKLDKEAAPQGVSLNLDDKFSIQGGTIVNRVTMASATIAGDLAVDNTTLCVDSANNRVGIGTCSPSAALNINAATTINGAVTVNSSVTFNPSLSNSSSSFASSAHFSFTNTTFPAGLCVPGSSVTITASGTAPVEYCYSGQCLVDTAAQSVFFTIWLDGNYAPPLVSANSAMAFDEDSASYLMNCSFCFLTNTPSAASHTYCLLPRVSGGTGQVFQNGSPYTSQFRIREIK